MRSFHDFFPQTAEEETRCTAIGEGCDIPPGKYLFVESYCTEKGCDCRNVLLTVIERKRGAVATINYSFDPRGIAARVGLDDLVLDPFNPQSDLSPAILDLFKSVVLTEDYRERLKNHYRMVKDLIERKPELAEPSLWDAPDPGEFAILRPVVGQAYRDRRRDLRKLRRQAQRRNRPRR